MRQPALRSPRLASNASGIGLRRLGQFRYEHPHLLPVTSRLREVGLLRPQRPAPVPLGRTERLARLLPVKRQERGALVELLGVELSDRPCHRRVRPRPALAELRSICHLLRQRMLEGVLRLRVERHLVDELGGSELAE